MISCCALLAPRWCLAECIDQPSLYVNCPELGVYGPGSQWFTPDHVLFDEDPNHGDWVGQTGHVVASAQQTNLLPKLEVGHTRVSMRHRKEVTLTQDCWRLTVRAFSKVELFCSSNF